MPIPIKCACGRSLRLKDALAGKKVRCPECSAVLSVPRLEEPEDAELAALEVLQADAQPEDRLNSQRMEFESLPVRPEERRPKQASVTSARPANTPAKKPAKKSSGVPRVAFEE